MAIIFALLAAGAYGVSDFLGGMASRHAATTRVLLVTYPVGAALMAALLPIYGGPISARTLGWSVAAGVAGLVAIGLFYHALARARMSVISPVTAVLAAAVPVVGGVALGERPSALGWFGMLVGLIAVVLICRQPEHEDHPRVGWAPLAIAVVAGIGFGAYFVCLSRCDDDSGMWPVVLSRLAPLLALLPWVALVEKSARIPARGLALAAGCGCLDACANAAFLLATRHGLLSLSSVITALYPAGTVLLAVWVLGEPTGRTQQAGLAVAVASVVLLSV